MSSSKTIIFSLAERAGIAINGANPWDIAVRDERFYHRVLAEGSLGLGESYMDEWWECDAIDEMSARLLRADADKTGGHSLRLLPAYLSAVIRNAQSKRRAFRIGEFHYDLGNDLYRLMLDRRMTYSCGYWKHAATLDHAQEAKLELVCQKLKLQPGMRVLDIGCGWGSFAAYAAEKHGVSVVGISVSKEQVALGTELCRGLQVELRLQDYRDVNEPFDRIVSIGMFEHVGWKNYRAYMRAAERCLVHGGLFLLHTIGSAELPRKTTDPWISKYIFPNSYIPSLSQIARAAEGLFLIEDIHNISADYDPTLMAWYRNVAAHREEIEAKRGKRFYRMWTYYLRMCAGLFRARKMQVWQMVFAKSPVLGRYEGVRERG